MRSTMNGRLLRTLAGLTLAILAAAGAHAEVGAVSHGGASPYPPVTFYLFEIIGDDPVPIGGIWHVGFPGFPGHVILNPGGEANGDGQPSFVRNPATGLMAAAWARNSASGYDVVISRFENGGWTEPQVLAGTPANEFDPQLVLDPDGSVHLFYWVDGSTPQVLYRHAPADVSSWSAPVPVSQPGQAACRPAGVVHGGVLRVTYEVHDFGFGNSPREIVLARYDSGAFTPEIVAMTNNLGDVRPQVHSQSGRLWVDWVDAQSGSSGEFGWTRLDAQGHWEPIHFQGFGNREQRDYLGRGAIKLLALQ